MIKTTRELFMFVAMCLMFITLGWQNFCYKQDIERTRESNSLDMKWYQNITAIQGNRINELEEKFEIRTQVLNNILMWHNERIQQLETNK